MKELKVEEHLRELGLPAEGVESGEGIESDRLRLQIRWSAVVVESGEGIERHFVLLLPLVLPHLWNPVKELKDLSFV